MRLNALSPNETRSVSGYALKIANFLFCVSHVSLMRTSYRRLANEFVTQLEIVDNLVPETTQLHERQKPTESSQFQLSKTRVA